MDVQRYINNTTNNNNIDPRLFAEIHIYSISYARNSPMPNTGSRTELYYSIAIDVLGHESKSIFDQN